MRRLLSPLTVAYLTLCVGCGSATPPTPSILTQASQPAPAAATVRPVTVAPAATAAPTSSVSATGGASAGSQLTGQFTNPLATIEDLDPLQIELGRIAGVANVTGSETSLTITYDPSRVPPERLRQVLADLGHPLR